MERRMQETAYCLAGETTPIADLMERLGNTNGYKASAIFGDNGESLYSNAIDPSNKENLRIYYGQANRLANKSAFDSCGGLAIRVKDDVMVILSSAENCLVKVRLIVLISKQANEVLMQMYLRNLLPQIMRSITWDPDNLVPLYMREAKRRQAISTTV